MSQPTAAGLTDDHRPLRIEHEWEGCFAYHMLQEGHTWHFSNLEKWKRLSFKTVFQEKPYKEDEKPHKEIASYFTQVIQNQIYNQAAPLAGNRLEQNASLWQLLSWFKGENGPSDPPVRHGLSLVLNALIRYSTLKPFEVLSSFCKEHVTVEIHGLGDHVPSWFYIEGTPFEDLDEHLISFPELFQQEEIYINDLLRRLLYVRILHKYEVKGVERSDAKILGVCPTRSTWNLR